MCSPLEMGGLAKKDLVFGGGLLPPNMVRAKGGGLLKIVEGLTGVAFGVVLISVGRDSLNTWLLRWEMVLAFIFGIGGLGISLLKCSILSYMHVLETRKPVFLTCWIIMRMGEVDVGM